MENDSNKDKILFYEREYYMFSNFSSFSVEYDGVFWMTSEHAYQAAKFTDSKIRKEIEDAKSSHDAFKIARGHSNDYKPDWYDIRVNIMKDIVRAKTDQHTHIKEKLLETNTKEIVENSPVDDFWGWGANKDGRNELGKIWMEIREEIRK